MSKAMRRALTVIAAAVLVVGVQAGSAYAVPTDKCTFGWPGAGECSQSGAPR